MNEYVNIGAVANKLLSEGRHTKFAYLVNQATDVASAQADLTAAGRCLRLLFKLAAESRAGEAAQERNVIAGSLFAHAVILYARATAMSSDNRNGWWGKELLNNDQWEFHLLVMELRSNAIAHFGRAEHMPRGPMIEESYFLINHRGASFMTIESKRTQHQSGFDQAFLELIDETVSIAEQKEQKLRAAIMDEIVRISSDDALFVHDLRNATTDIPEDLKSYIENNETGRLTVFRRTKQT